VSFPRSPTLDRFRRPDAADLGANYSIVTGYNGLPVASYRCAIENSPGYQVWSHNRFDINQQIWAVVEDEFVDMSKLWLSFRCDSAQPTSGYRCEIVQEDGILHARLYNISTETEIDSSISLGIIGFSSGDLVGIDALGYRFTLYYRPVGGAVVSLGQWYDTAVALPGYIGLGAEQLSRWWTGPWPAPYNAVPSIDLSDVVVVYQPKPAIDSIYGRTVIDFTASLVNINAPGVNDALAPSPPGFSADGWTGNASGYIDTGLIQLSQDETLLAAHNLVSSASGIFRVFQSSEMGLPSVAIGYWDVSNQYYLRSNYSGEPGLINYGSALPWLATSGVSENRAYSNGAAFGSNIAPLAGVMPYTVTLMAAHIGEDEVIDHLVEGSIAAFVWYRPAITSAQIEAVSWAMEVIRSA